MNIFLTGYEVPVNPYPDDAGVIDILKAIFVPIWEGLSNINFPGFDFTFAQFLIAILTAGLVGLILKTAFYYFGSHLVDGGSSSGKRSSRHNEKSRSKKKGN